MPGKPNWKLLTKKELLHLIEGNDELENKILVFLQLDRQVQKSHNYRCRFCESIEKKLNLAELGILTSLD